MRVPRIVLRLNPFAPLAAMLLALALLVQSGSPSIAQTSDAGMEAIVEQARKEGSTVIIMRPGETTAPAAPEMTMTSIFSSANLLQARSNLARMVANTTIFIENLPASLKAASPDGKDYWLGLAVATAIGGLALGRFFYFMTARWGRDHFQAVYDPHETRRSRKVGYLMLRAGWMLLSAGIMFVTAALVAIALDMGHEPSRETIYVIISTYVAYRILRSVIFWNVFAPGAPAHRMINLDDVQAERMFRHWALALAIGAIIIGICRWIQLLGIGDMPANAMSPDVARDAHSLALIVGLFVCAGMMGALAISHRHDLVQILASSRDPAVKISPWRRVVASLALPAILVYLAAAWFVSSVRLALGQPGGYIPVLAPIMVFVTAVFAYGLAAWLLEIFYERREATHRRRQLLKLQAERRAWRRTQASKQLMSEMSEDVRDMLEDGDEMTVMAPSMAPSTAIKPYFPAFKQFFQSTIQATILVVCVGQLARLWGVDISREGHPLSATLDILFVVIVAISFYRAVNRFIDFRIVEEGGTLDSQPFNPGDGDNENGKSQSRLATLLPIFRNVIVSALGVVGFMVILANLGVDIGPLFAGAGVIGIAIGFGAQTLIRDIFSGAFFLIDDAFRKGEYIEIDSVKGVVEKISMRSFQLRHHLGAVHTVPFGEIKRLTNYSRDWVMMKLPLRLTYDTDVEKVRKLIKKLGQQLLQDPVVGPLFLQPLKSQGVYAMEDSAMIVRVKYMTRPGDQFVTRKVVYAAIREIFNREGIRFAHREVTVRLADGQKVESLSEEQKEAIAGSVRSVIEDERPANDAGKLAAAAL